MRLTLRTVTVGLGVALAAASAHALCIWDTDTIRDELQTKASDFDLITGQFPHHSKGYYEARVKQAEAALAKDPKSIVARNDLAVALLKLGRYEESKAQFATIEAQQPGRYETLSNLGVLHKKWGKFAEASDYTAKALAIKPSGHLGLGDYYLKMLRWQAANSEPAPRRIQPQATYLGYKYTDSYYKVNGKHPNEAARQAHFEKIKALVRSDRTFADGQFVLGDLYHSKWDLNLAMWAYVRALDLGHPRADIITQRMGEIFKHWAEAAKHKGGRKLESRESTVGRMRSWLKTYTRWQSKFEAVEAELIAKDGLAKVDFKRVEAELKRRKILRMRPAEAGIIRTGVGRDANAWDAKSPARGGVTKEAEAQSNSDSRRADELHKVAEKLQKLERKSKSPAKKGE